jgi:hypothetical protein
MSVATFTRLYRDHGAGPEYPATPERVSAVLASMQEARDSSVPFATLLRMDDGSSVTVRPKARR